MIRKKKLNAFIFTTSQNTKYEPNHCRYDEAVNDKHDASVND